MAQRKFDELYSMSDDKKKLEKKPLLERRIKRNFQAALDDVDGQELDALETKQAAFSKLEKLDVNCILDISKVLTRAGNTKAEIKKIYKELFDEELTPADPGA